MSLNNVCQSCNSNNIREFKNYSKCMDCDAKFKRLYIMNELQTCRPIIEDEDDGSRYPRMEVDRWGEWINIKELKEVLQQWISVMEDGYEYRLDDYYDNEYGTFGYVLKWIKDFTKERNEKRDSRNNKARCYQG